MLVFTLPSYPYVFKIIKDVFGASKNMDRETVKAQIRDGEAGGSGRSHGDTLEFSYGALPLSRFHPDFCRRCANLRLLLRDRW